MFVVPEWWQNDVRGMRSQEFPEQPLNPVSLRNSNLQNESIVVSAGASGSFRAPGQFQCTTCGKVCEVTQRNITEY